MTLTFLEIERKRKLYPNLTLDEIIEELDKFEKEMLTISEHSCHWGKYLRGWLSKANSLKDKQ